MLVASKAVWKYEYRDALRQCINAPRAKSAQSNNQHERIERTFQHISALKSCYRKRHFKSIMTGQKQTDPANSYKWQIHNMAFLCRHLLFPLITLVSISIG